MTLSIDCAQITGRYFLKTASNRIHTFTARVFRFNVLGVKVIAVMKTIYCKTLLWTNSVLTIYTKSNRIVEIQFIYKFEVFLVC